jgi:hypothetical protein
MNQKLNKLAVPGLRWALGLVVLWQACRELLHTLNAVHGHNHALPMLWVRLVLAGAEIAGAILFLLPRMRIAGSYLLLGVFVLAMGIHIAHGDWGILSLSVYVMAVLVSLANQ